MRWNKQTAWLAVIGWHLCETYACIAAILRGAISVRIRHGEETNPRLKIFVSNLGVRRAVALRSRKGAINAGIMPRR